MPGEGAVADHDNGYKLLFSHPEMVRDLLEGFVAEEWVYDLDFSTLERFPASYVSHDLRSREGDVVWRVRWKGQLLYVYLLIEFQSAVDPFMAVRMLVYLGLLYQDLIRKRLLTPSGRLPPVFPLVLYNGIRRWSAPRDVADLVEAMPGGLEAYRPQLRYFLLDEGRLAEEDLEPLRNLAAALFRLEKSRDPEDVREVVRPLLEWLRGAEQQELRRAFGVWLRQVLLPARLPGIEMPEITDLQEVDTMLAERVQEWTREWKKEGFQEGLEQARAVLLREVETRFGPLSPETRRRIGETGSVQEVAERIARVATAPSLASLGLE
jgi:predicted transposase/invertase (TIGR01784 family)